MTLEQFLGEIEAVYEPYRPGGRKYVQQWLEGATPALLQRLFREVLRTYPTRWGIPPWISDMDPIRSQIEAQMQRERREAEFIHQAKDLVAKDHEEPELSEDEARQYFDQFRRMVRRLATAKEAP